MAVTPETLEAFFGQYGWTFERTGEGDLGTDLRTGFRGDTGVFRIYVRLVENWVFFSIAPFVVAPRDPECERKLHRFLLRKNYEMNIAKFTVDEDGDVILTVELPTASLDYSEFADALGALAYYADDAFTQTFILAHVPQAHSLYEEKQDLDWGAG